MREGGILRKDAVARLLTLPGEELVAATRKHWLILLARLSIALFILFPLFIVLSASFLFFSFPQALFFAILLSLFVVTIAVTLKVIIDWYCHIYVVTTRKLIEICFTPLFSGKVNKILLDQVRCTEVDVRKDGIFNELFDIGDIIVTFDRPTHEQEFLFAGIRDSDKIGYLLSNMLVQTAKSETKTVWFRKADQPHTFRFTEEIFPGSFAGA